MLSIEMTTNPHYIKFNEEDLKVLREFFSQYKKWMDENNLKVAEKIRLFIDMYDLYLKQVDYNSIPCQLFKKTLQDEYIKARKARTIYTRQMLMMPIPTDEILCNNFAIMDWINVVNYWYVNIGKTRTLNV